MVQYSIQQLLLCFNLKQWLLSMCKKWQIQLAVKLYNPAPTALCVDEDRIKTTPSMELFSLKHDAVYF